MVDKKQLEEVYKQNLESDIINEISEMKGIDLRKAFDIYYSSKLAEQISNDSYGIENMDAKYLAEDLIENEPEFFEGPHAPRLPRRFRFRTLRHPRSRFLRRGQDEHRHRYAIRLHPPDRLPHVRTHQRSAQD